MHGGLPLLSGKLHETASRRAALLKPGIWRGVVRDWSFDMSDVNRSGAAPIIQLGALWGLPGRWPAVWPQDDLSAWNMWVRRKAAGVARWVPRGPVWVDIWNEPDIAAYWPVERDPQLKGWMSAFAVAEHAVRDVIGSRARVIGPSTQGNSNLWTGRLVAYCATHSCRLDAVAWHSLGGPISMSGLGAALRKARARASKDQQWRKVLGPHPKFFVTEYNPYANRFSPGAMLAYWAQIEAGKADAAALSVWTHNGPAADGLLDGLLDSAVRPRSTWWAARAYAVGRASRVIARSSDPLVPAIASSRGAHGSREVLVGAWGPRVQRVSVVMKGISRRAHLKAKVAVFREVKAPWNGTLSAPSATPLKVWRRADGAVVATVVVPAGAAASVILG